MASGGAAPLSTPARRLARCLSGAALVEPALLRGMRLELVREAGVEAEAEIHDWGLVETRSPRGFTFERGAADALRTELAHSDDLARAAAILARYHAHAPVLLRLEERIIDAVLRARSQREPSANEAIAEELDAVMATMEAIPSRRRDLASWAARTLPRLPEEALIVSSTRVLSYVASAHVRTARGLGGALSSSEARRARPLLPKREGVPVFVRRLHDGVEFAVRKRPADGSWQAFHVADTDPVVLTLNGEGITLSGEQRLRFPLEEDEALVLATVDGREWALQTGSVADGIATLSGSVRFSAYAYLVDRDLAVAALVTPPGRTEAASVGMPARLEFPWGPAQATLVSLGNAISPACVFRLARPAPDHAQPLPLGADPLTGAECKFLLARKNGTDQWIRAVAVPYDVKNGRVALDASRPLHPGEAQAASGGVVLIDGCVAAHVEGPFQAGVRNPQTVLGCPASLVAESLLVHLRDRVPRSVRDGANWHTESSNDAAPIRLCAMPLYPGLAVSPVALATRGEALFAFDVSGLRFWYSAWQEPIGTPSSVPSNPNSRLAVVWSDEDHPYLASIAPRSQIDPSLFLSIKHDREKLAPYGMPVFVDGEFLGFATRSNGGDWSVDAVAYLLRTEAFGRFGVSSETSDFQSLHSWASFYEALPYLRLAQVAMEHLQLVPASDAETEVQSRAGERTGSAGGAAEKDDTRRLESVYQSLRESENQPEGLFRELKVWARADNGEQAKLVRRILQHLRKRSLRPSSEPRA